MNRLRESLWPRRGSAPSSAERPEGGICLVALKGNLRGHYSIRINDQWRLVFCWSGGQAENAQIVDYRDFHADANFNFQLNRWLPFLPESELREAAAQIEDFDDWKRVLWQYAQRA